MNGDDLTPLQFALIRGNTELALELIRAGSTTDQPNTGWKSSALVLAIIGDGIRGDKNFWGNDCIEFGVFEDGSTEEYEAGDTRYDADDCLVTQTQEATDRLFNLIGSLINAGAATNLSDIGQLGRTQFEISDNAALLDDIGQTVEQSFFLLQIDEIHTPLSVASKCQRKDIVDILIRNNADVKFLTDQGTSALHECLYSRDQMAANLWFGMRPPLQGRDVVSRGYKLPDLVVEVVRSLLDAGANVHEKFYCRDIYELPRNYSGPNSYTIFDLGVLTGSMEIINILISAGAQIIPLSVEYAIQFESLDIFNRFLQASALVSTNAEIITTNHQDECLQAATKKGNMWIKEVALLKAIRSGNVSTIDYLCTDGTFGCRGVLDKSTELVEAIESCCYRGHITALQLVLQDSLRCRFSLSPWFGGSLCLAILNEQDEVIDTLLSAGADVNAMGPDGKTPLSAAIMTKNQKLFERLIGMGATLNPNTPYSLTCSGVHGVSGDSLIAAIHWGNGVVINRLLEMGADIEAFGTTEHKFYSCLCIIPLTAALMAKNSDLVHDLVRRGVKINNLLDGDSANTSRMTPLAAAIQMRDSEMVDFIIRGGANIDDPMAIRAAMSDNEPHGIMAILCSHLRDIKSEFTLSFALTWALKCNPHPNLEIIRILLSFGAEPNTFLRPEEEPPNTYRWRDYSEKGSTLDWAVNMDHNLELVKILLQAGAKADTGILFGTKYSPVQSAVKRRDQAVARMLLDYGSNPDSVPTSRYHTKDPRAPLQIAVHKKDVEMIRILFQYRADPNVACIEEDVTHLDYALNCVPRTPLQEASMEGSKEIVEIILEHGADVNFPPVTGDGATALQYAAMQGFLGIAHLLLEHDADVNAPPAKIDGRTALEGAAEHGRVDMVQLLLNAGANIFGDGQTQYENAIRRASENGHHAIRRMLEKHHADRE
ncbi:hypothetical protein V502_07858 [Pseudogymnoascus sp. VKM F-4520 (FW-2644)]|nr:hypothetical protein V502_07858 [Pseudogymnoascus sp. VKM F-4520 (FW-2644)]